MIEEDYVKIMQNCGWYENEAGDITNDKFPGCEYHSWTDAIIAMIEIGSGV